VTNSKEKNKIWNLKAASLSKITKGLVGDGWMEDVVKVYKPNGTYKANSRMVRKIAWEILSNHFERLR